jgi:uncharacterized protein (DUF305 family)
MPSTRCAYLAVILIALAFTGCGGDDASKGDAPSPSSSSPVPFDRSFIDAMVPHHESAIEMATSAKNAGLTQPDLIEIADNIIASQQSEIDQMRGWRDDWFGSADIDPDGASALGMSDAEMGMEHDAGEIEGAADVDAAFAQAMIPHHEGAIAMAKLAQKRGQHEEIKTLAGEIIAAQQGEIETLAKHAGGEHHG